MGRSKEREEASEPETNESTESREHRGFVRYVNTADVRSISKKDLWDVGMTGDNLVDLNWTRENQWCVPRSDIPDDVYDRAIKPDTDFVLVEPED